MKPIKIHSSAAGFTLIETLVSIGILALMVGSVGTVIFQTTKMQAGIEDRSAANEFIASFSKQLTTSEGCKTMLSGKDRPPPVTGAPAALSIDAADYKGYGSKAGVDVAAGFPVSPRISVSTLSIRDKGVPVVVGKTNLDLGPPVGVTVVTYDRIVAQIQVQLQSQVAGVVTQLPVRYIEVPVIIRRAPASVDLNKIDDCAVIASSMDTCQTLGGTFNSVTNTCTPGTSCTLVGKVHSCDSPDQTCSKFNFAGSVVFNSLTPPGLSCPIGSTAVSNGSVNYRYPVGSGKTMTVLTLTADLFNCLQCQ